MIYKDQEIHDALNYLHERGIYKDDLVSFEPSSGYGDYAWFVGLVYHGESGVLAVVDFNEEVLQLIHYKCLTSVVGSKPEKPARATK